jgi:hypothetical protein
MKQSGEWYIGKSDALCREGDKCFHVIATKDGLSLMEFRCSDAVFDSFVRDETLSNEQLRSIDYLAARALPNAVLELLRNA